MKLRSYLVAALALCTLCFVGCEDWDWDHHSKKDGTEPAKAIKIVSFGNPNCANAVEDPEVQIANLKINGRSGMSYTWAKNDLSKWGLAYSAADALAIAGYEEGDHFCCAKFDWISSSRRTRDFNNINTGYNGWQPEKFHNAKRKCFFIMSKNGSKRTNVIIAE